MVKQNIEYIDFKNKVFKNAYNKIKKANNILIWGDEDPDGMTATSIIFFTLKKNNKNVEYFIPSRKKHGIGLTLSLLKEFIKKKKIDLLITVDCGTVNYNEIKFLIDNNIDVIITDHHIPHKERIEKAVYINTHWLKSKKFKHLSGAGVSFILCVYLNKHFQKINTYNNVLNTMQYEAVLAAIGTFCDKVKITGFNKYLIKYFNSIEIYLPLSQQDNICGILYQSKTFRKKNKIIDILSNNIKNKNIIINTINNYKKQEKKHTKHIEYVYNKELNKINKSQNIILHFNSRMDASIIGIIASKISESINKPVCIIAKRENIFIGEARANNGFNWQKTLKKFEKYFINWGGHKPAAGFSITKEKLYEFINDFNAHYN